MPTNSMFYGILIRMFFFDTDKHKAPHVHAEFQGVLRFIQSRTENCSLESYRVRTTK